MGTERFIPLTRGLKVVVDGDVFDALGVYNWRAHSNGRGDVIYPRRHVRPLRDRKILWISMARMVSGAPSGCRVLYRNRNHLDCRRENLVVVTSTKSKLENWPGSQFTGSAFRGVAWDAFYGCWRGHFEGAIIDYYESELEAAHRYNQFVTTVFKGQAALNRLRGINL